MLKLPCAVYYLSWTTKFSCFSIPLITCVTSRIARHAVQAPMRVGDQFLACSVTIMEGDDMQFLFGLDMLRRHQCQAR